MKLNNSQNIKLLQSCAQVKIIELTEKIAFLKEEQIDIIKQDPNLHIKLTQYNRQQSYSKNIQFETYTAKELLEATDLSKVDCHGLDHISKLNFQKLSKTQTTIENSEKALEEYRELASKLSNTKINKKNIDSLLDVSKHTHTSSYVRFAEGIKKHTPAHLARFYKRLADNIAARNNISNKKYYAQSDETFSMRRIKVTLAKDYKARYKSNGTKLAIAAALAAGILIGANIPDFNGSQHEEDEQIDDLPINTINTSKDFDSLIDQVEYPEIFTVSNSKKTTYSDACEDYFQKISDIYKYKTGKTINLSNYTQDDIGYAESANVLKVEKDGVSYVFSGVSENASNFTYLKKSLEATGAKVTEDRASLSYIINKDTKSSIVIADSNGNAVRSGNILVGTNNMYNPDYVKAGKAILEKQGKKNCTQAECVGAYLLSDKHATDPDLAQALSDVEGLTTFIKTSFYNEPDGTDSVYTVSMYAEKSKKFEKSYSDKIYKKLLERAYEKQQQEKQQNFEDKLNELDR